MKDYIQKVRVLILLGLIVNSANLFCSNCTEDNKNTINAIIGDVSYIEKFGENPTPSTDSDLRITTHLQYIEKLLRKKKVAHLSKEQSQKRDLVLNLLHDYWVNGVFPKNYDYERQRLPCFIDQYENICAVGYLIEKTDGRLTAAKINDEYKYEFILSMRDKSSEDWMLNYGLTKLECAMIQPTYNFQYEIDEEIILIPEWENKKKNKLYNKNKEVTAEGVFKAYQLINGKKYIYDENGLLIRIELYRKGKFIGGSPIVEKS